MKIKIGEENKGEWGKLIIEYLVQISYPGYKIKWTNENCHFIVSSHNHFNNHFNGTLWNKEKKPYIYWSGEHTSIEKFNKYHSDYLVIDTLKNIEYKYLYVPFICMSPYLLKGRLFTNKNREYFIAYCSSTKYKHREDFFNLCIENYPKKPATDYCKSLGLCYGNYKSSNSKINGSWLSNELIKEYSKYNFVFAMENHDKDGYITEKIINAFVSGAIPIFYGNKIVNEFFNKKAFINVSDFNNLNDCVQFIINMNENQIHKMMDEPIFNWKNNRIHEILEIGYFPPNKYYKNLSNQLKKIIDPVLKIK